MPFMYIQILAFMDLQKKRTSTKKGKASKTQAPLELPLTPLIQQINQLKSQLANMKSKKNLKSMKELQERRENSSKQVHTEMLSPKSQLNRTTQKLAIKSQLKQGLKEIIFPIRETEMKLNIELNKLYQHIKDRNEDRSVASLNRLISSLNASIRELETQNRVLQSKEEDFPHYDWREQARLYQQLNNELEKENIQLKHMLAKQVDEVEELECINLQMKDEFEVMARSLMSSEGEIEKGRILCGGLREERRELEEKLKVYERSIEKKQSQLLLYEEDINFARMEVEKSKIQKREMDKLYENIQKQYRQLKSKYEIDVEALTKQKNKWKSECQIRREVEKQTIGHEELKTQLKRELEATRRQCGSLNEQLSQLKVKLCDQQKKIISQDERNFRLETENEKLQRSVEYCKAEMKELAKEVEELRQQSQKYRDIALRSKMGVKNTGKAQALQQIQDLIKFHRRNEDELH